LPYGSDRDPTANDETIHKFDEFINYIDSIKKPNYIVDIKSKSECQNIREMARDIKNGINDNVKLFTTFKFYKQMLAYKVKLERKASIKKLTQEIGKDKGRFI